MIRKATEKDTDDILETLKRDILSNVYMYIDIVNYGINKEEFAQLWIAREDGQIKTLVLKYYSSFQLYMVSDVDFSDVLELVFKHQPSMISGRAQTIKRLGFLLSESYKATCGVVLLQPFIELGKLTIEPEAASISDMEEIARLICSDESIGSHYDTNELTQQLLQRSLDKTGRSYVVRDNGRIIGHYGTYAEASEIAVMGGLIVSKEHRGKGIARILHQYVSNSLIEESKRAVLFCSDEQILKMYLYFGAKICSDYGKLTLKN